MKSRDEKSKSRKSSTTVTPTTEKEGESKAATSQPVEINEVSQLDPADPAVSGALDGELSGVPEQDVNGPRVSTMDGAVETVPTESKNRSGSNGESFEDQVAPTEDLVEKKATQEQTHEGIEPADSPRVAGEHTSVPGISTDDLLTTGQSDNTAKGPESTVEHSPTCPNCTHE
jgi:hypothetical protein